MAGNFKNLESKIRYDRCAHHQKKTLAGKSGFLTELFVV
jgi:hypothetical protein